MRHLQTQTLRWATGILCALFGTLMLITPHQFVSPAYLAFQPGLPWWGTAFLVVGGALLSVTVLAMNRPYVATAELAAALLLLLLAAGFWRVNGWTGVVVYGSLGLGLMLAALQLDDYRLRSRPDLLALMVGLSSAINGLIILLAPGQFTGFFYDAMRWHLPLNGAAFLLSGLALLAAHLLPRMPQLLFWLCHLLAAGALGFWFFTNPLPLRLLTGYGYYGGVGLAMALLPWLGPKLVRTDPAALRVRLALLLAACAALPLILTLTLITNQQEQLAARQTMTTYQFDAQELAGNISRVVQMHRAALATLAVDSNLAVLPASEQQARLAAFQQRYPSFSTVLLLRPDQPLVVSNAATAPPDIPATVVEQLRTTGGPQLLPSANDTAPPVVLLGAPLRSPSGQLSGTLIGLMDEASLPTELSVARTSADMVIYLTTADGALLAQPESRPATSRAAAPPLQALAASDAPAGTLRYTSATGEWLSGFARLPDLNWNVVVERPVNAALATVWAGRELAFLALLGMMGVAVLAGLLLARQLAHPLDQLAKAADRLAEGNTAEPLPQSRISEVAHLSAIFGTMRDRLVARTAERDTLYEAERAARETAEAAVQMRETFLSVASHELKTPLTSLLGNTELLQRRASREQLLNERNLRSVNVIHEQAQRLSRLIEALLDISRLQKGQLTIEPSPLDIAALVQRLVASVQPALRDHTISYTGPVGPVTITGDALRLEQVVQNLVQNAIKYSPAGGPITVCIELTASEVAIRVADKGMGIPAGALPQLFTRFYRAANANPRQISGLGIGLYVVKEIVARHRGRVEVASEEGQGSTFSIYLPYTPGNGILPLTQQQLHETEVG